MDRRYLDGIMDGMALGWVLGDCRELQLHCRGFSVMRKVAVGLGLMIRTYCYFIDAFRDDLHFNLAAVYLVASRL